MRWIFLKDCKFGADSYRAGLCYQVPDEDLQFQLQMNNLAYREDEEPPIDPDTLDRMIAAETRDDDLVYKLDARRRIAVARRERERLEAETRNAEVRAARSRPPRRRPRIEDNTDG